MTMRLFSLRRAVACKLAVSCPPPSALTGGRPGCPAASLCAAPRIPFPRAHAGASASPKAANTVNAKPAKVLVPHDARGECFGLALGAGALHKTDRLDSRIAADGRRIETLARERVTQVQ